MNLYVLNIKNLIVITLLSSSLGIISCNHSKFSKGKVENLSMIGAVIEVSQNASNKDDNYVSVELFDDSGDRIANDSVKIYANNVALEFNKRQGLYYTEESYYGLSNIPVDKVHELVIRLTNGKKYVLAKIWALKEENIANIECDENGDFNNDGIIKWKGLKDINELSITPVLLLKTDNVNEESYEYQPAIVKNIESNGIYILKKSQYRHPKSTISSYEIEFRTTKLGNTNSTLLKRSNIQISTSIKKVIDFNQVEDEK